MNPEQNILNEIARLDQANILHDKLQRMAELKKLAVTEIEHDIAMEAIDEILDHANKFDLAPLLGQIALDEQ